MQLQQAYQETLLPGRTRYQLRHFAIGQHDTPAMQYRQVLFEAEKLAYDIASAELDCRRKNIEIERLLKTGDELDEITAEEKRLGLAMTERKLAGARLELSWLQEIADELGHHSTEQIEADQPNYWRLRLSRQAGMDKMSVIEGVGAANLTCMLQAGLLTREETPCLSISSGS